MNTDTITEQSLRSPDCSPEILESVLKRGVMDWQSLIAARNPNAPEAAVWNWRKHRRPFLPYDPNKARLTPEQGRRRRNIPQFPEDEEIEKKGFLRYFTTQFRADLLRMVLAIPPESRHHPEHDDGRNVDEYALLDCSYFVGNFCLPFGSYPAQSDIQSSLFKTALDTVVIQPCWLEKPKDGRVDVMAHIAAERLPRFMATLFWVVAYDQTVYTYHRHSYEPWRELTMFPKWRGDCMSECAHHLHPLHLLDAVKSRMPATTSRRRIHPDLNAALVDSLPGIREWLEYFLVDNLPQFDGDVLCQQCFGEVRKFINLNA